jgi:hypothetical protein
MGCHRGEDHDMCDAMRYRDITANGVKVRSWCMTCQRTPPGEKPFVAVKSIAPDVLVALPAWPVEPGTMAPCAVCGTVAALETHHFAPRHLFGSDCNKWPTADLCGPCHRRWHDLVTPTMSKRRA